MEDHRIISAIKKFETPLYLYDSVIIQKQIEKLKKATGNTADIFYSLKANPNIGIAQFILSHSVNAEVCSLAELKTALEAGFLPENIIFVGPCKSDYEISLSIELGIFAIVCESLYEVQRVNIIARKLDKKTNILIRINPDFYVESAPLKMGGVPSQFGIDLHEFPENFSFAIYENLNIRGIHVYNGTRILNAQHLASNMQKIFLLSESLSKQWGVEFDALDLGGGFGVAYFEQENPLDVEQLTLLLAEQFKTFKQKYPNIRLIIESGRFLVAESGFFVSSICDIKSSHGENFLITDGGMNCHMAATGIGSFLRRNFKITALYSATRTKDDELHLYNITGPLCTPGDLIGKNVDLPKVQVGDFIIISTSGAYGPSASPVLFLGHGYPAEVLVTANQDCLIRQRDSVEDVLRNQFKITSVSRFASEVCVIS